MSLPKLNRGLINLALAILSGILLALPWTLTGAFPLFVAIVPLLFIESSGISRKMQFLFNALAIVVWHILAVLWIAKAAPIGVYSSALVYLVLWNTALLSYSYARKNFSRKIAYFVLISGLVAIEHLNLSNTEITFPWLVMGNGFAKSLYLIQWYELTGVLGGSLLAIIINILIFESIQKRRWQAFALACGLVAAALGCSQILYHKHNPHSGQAVEVAVIQPNFDPYKDKFTMSKGVQLQIIDSIFQEVSKDVDYIVFPETALNEELDEKMLDHTGTIQYLKRTLSERFPKANIIFGAVTYQLYGSSKERPTLTARGNNAGGWYDVSNSSLSICSDQPTDLYRKSKLVIGVEMLPFNSVLSKLGDLSVKLGGTSGVLMPQENVGLFQHSHNSLLAGAPVCYESIYGDHYSGFVREGAELMFVITNDGWWDDTYGYQQHFTYSQLRAIESRRWIGRSANTGISAVIDSRGEVIEQLGWWKRGAIQQKMYSSNEMTFYTKYGDYIGSVLSYCYVLLMLYMVAISFRRRLLI